MSQNSSLDVEAMRAVAAGLLAAGTPYPRYDELDVQREQLSSHLGQLVPEVEALVKALPVDAPMRDLVLVTVENSRVRLGASPGPGLVSATAHARSLARELRALCGYHQVLSSIQAREPA